jgi:hypothetical protein
MSWIAVTHIGANQNGDDAVTSWAEPAFDAFCAGCWFLFWTDDTLYWVAKPTLHRDGQRRLHSELGPAVESDAEPLFFWHGVLVDPYLVRNPQLITVKHIEMESNAEVRRVMMERFGEARYLQESGAQEIHCDDFGVLFRKEVPGDEPLVMVKVVNSTPEPDGTLKDYWLRVPPNMERARQAVAWTFGKQENEYAPEVET